MSQKLALSGSQAKNYWPRQFVIDITTDSKLSKPLLSIIREKLLIMKNLFSRILNIFCLSAFPYSILVNKFVVFFIFRFDMSHESVDRV